MQAVLPSPQRVMYRFNTRMPDRGAPNYKRRLMTQGAGNRDSILRVDRLHLAFVGHLEGSVVHCLRKTGTDEWGAITSIGPEGRNTCCPERPVAPLSRTTIMLRSVKTE